MKKNLLVVLFTCAIFCAMPVHAQSFSLEKYAAFLNTNTDLPAGTLLSRYYPQQAYYKSETPTAALESFTYLDSIRIKYNLTAGELDLLGRNQFVVTERLSFDNIGPALNDVYNKDLPLFLSTDLVLQTVHESYDAILIDVEKNILRKNLSDLANALYATMPQLQAKYDSEPDLAVSLQDVDLYVTMAKSLMDSTKTAPHYVSRDTFDAVWNAVQAEQYIEMPLFTTQIRNLDFSQFTVRGHYAGVLDYDTRDTLGPYFRAMMWLGRIDFLLTPPPDIISPMEEADIRRMSCDALLLNELLDMSGARTLLDANNEVIDFMVGESDNLTPGELSDIVHSLSISSAAELLDDSRYQQFRQALQASPTSGQKILSDVFMVDPFNAEPAPLPVSFKLMGQRFIVDSYIFSNVVFDRIIYNQQKIMRMMPSPLDALFVLGNDDAVQLLADELEKYPYASQLSALRYLVDSYDDSYWRSSLYNGWLGAIRTLNPSVDSTGVPFFMKTSAWYQEKINTQLASWAELRHDNLLYAKQSYTGGAGCSFPHTYVEPIPEFYVQIGSYAGRAYNFFIGIEGVPIAVLGYYNTLSTVMPKLAVLAEKELAREEFTAEDRTFLQEMLHTKEQYGTVYTGWIVDLYYVQNKIRESGQLIVDVHTQPTDEFMNIVGKVLHVGVGDMNLGVFLADSPSNGHQPMAYIGPVMSYYEKITDNFDRLTDERWKTDVDGGSLPARPDWVNSYLADAQGNAFSAGRELPSMAPPVGVQEDGPQVFPVLASYPNPFNPATIIRFSVSEPGPVILSVYSVTGQKLATLADTVMQPGTYEIAWDAGDRASGVYFCSLTAPGRRNVIRMVLVR